MIKSITTTKGTIIIREASLADAEQFRQLRLDALLDSPTAFSADHQMNLNQSMEYWQDRLREDEHATVFFAEHDHQIIGMTGIARGRSEKTKHNGMLWGVYISPAWRGLHIAETLIETCIEWAKARDVKIAKLGVVSTNKSAIRCYERCGFTTYGTEPRALLYEGQYYDEFLMSKLLNGS